MVLTRTPPTHPPWLLCRQMQPIVGAILGTSAVPKETAPKANTRRCEGDVTVGSGEGKNGAWPRVVVGSDRSKGEEYSWSSPENSPEKYSDTG
ncbi:hypothetical protein Tco_1302375 [Tanacetum coccineum]